MGWVKENLFEQEDEEQNEEQEQENKEYKINSNQTENQIRDSSVG